MPILDINESNQVSTSRTEDIPRRKYRSQEEMATSTIFSTDHSLDKIISYISGMKWTITYYRQSNNENDDFKKLDINLPATIQKYERINNLIVFSQSGLEQTDPDEIEGEIVIDAGFMPLPYDMFMATLTGGREAIFNITEVDSRIYHNRKIFYLKFRFIIFVDQDKDLYNNLLYKTVREYYYDKDYLLSYTSPILLATDYNKKLNLHDKYQEIVDYYFDTFVHPSKHTLSPPTVSGIYTDTMLTDFIFKIVDQDSNDKIYKLIRMDPDKVDTVKPTIWDAIIERDSSMLRRCKKRIGFKYVPYTTNSVRARTFNYLGVKFLAGELKDNDANIEPSYIDISTLLDYYPNYNNKDEDDRRERSDETSEESGYIPTNNDNNTDNRTNDIHIPDDTNKESVHIMGNNLGDVDILVDDYATNWESDPDGWITDSTNEETKEEDNKVEEENIEEPIVYSGQVIKFFDTVYWNSSTNDEPNKYFAPIMKNKVLILDTNVDNITVKVLPNLSYKDVNKFTKSITPIIEKDNDNTVISLKCIHNSKAKYPDIDYFNIRVKFLDKDDNEVLQTNDYKLKITYLDSPYVEPDVTSDTNPNRTVNTYGYNAPILFNDVPTTLKNVVVNDTILPNINHIEDVIKVETVIPSLSPYGSDIKDKPIEANRPIDKIKPTDKIIPQSNYKTVYKEPIDDPKEDLTLPLTFYKDEYVPPIKYPDDNYVVSINTYMQNLDKLGLLEKCLMQYFRSEIVNRENIEILTKQYHMWSTKEQYYLIPILLVIIKDSISSMFKPL